MRKQQPASALEVRSTLPEVPTAESFSALLGNYMQISAVHFDVRWPPPLLRVEGSLKPDLRARTPSALRHSFLDSLDAVIAILDAGGAQWDEHPGLRYRGKAGTDRNGAPVFSEIECLVELRLLPGGAR